VSRADRITIALTVLGLGALVWLDLALFILQRSGV